MKLSIKVRKVHPLDDMTLAVEFENGVVKKYDVKQLIPQFPVFEQLQDRSLFDLVHVDCGGYAVACNDRIDISEYELWEGGENC